jgi:uncharacterized protein
LASGQDIEVHKLNHLGQEVWHYSGKVIERGATWVQLEAYFNRSDKDAGYVVFRQNDRFIEWFYSDQWYNIFEIHDVADDHLKGWYCNISRPAKLDDHDIYSDDLALDVWVAPQGNILTLDEDEFQALTLPTEDHQHALQAIDQLRSRVLARLAPFDQIPLS